MSEESQKQKHKLIENTGTAIAVATALEVVQSNASRSESMWARAGAFALNVIIGIGTLTLFDAVVGAFTKKRNKTKAASEESQPDMQDSAVTPCMKKSWAKEVSEQKSCGCPHRQH